MIGYIAGTDIQQSCKFIRLKVFILKIYPRNYKQISITLGKMKINFFSTLY